MKNKRTISELLKLYNKEINHRERLDDFKVRNVTEITQSLYSQNIIDFDERKRLRYYLSLNKHYYGK
jgi:hypothetical protein